MGLWSKIFGSALAEERADASNAIGDVPADAAPVISVEALHELFGSSGQSFYDGEKYPGGLGSPSDISLDYWGMRQRSAALFYRNPYGKGLIRRLVTNIINSGLHLEAEPDEAYLGIEPEALMDWSESVESRFELWGGSKLPDWRGDQTYGKIQQQVETQALVEGDVLKVYHVEKGYLQIELISGALVNTPLNAEGLKTGHRVDHGVEFDATDRQVAYWVEQKDGSHKRMPTHGAKTGRRLAKLVRSGITSMLGDVRGEPLLGVIIQSLNELDRYRDASLRKAVINAMLVMYLKKTEDKMGSKQLGLGAVGNNSVDIPQADGTTANRQFKSSLPGHVIEELQTGEEPVPHSTDGTDVNWTAFEAAALHAIAWCCEIPPEILQLSFSSNYSASQAAINEFRMYLNMMRKNIADEGQTEDYREWLVTESLRGDIERSAEILLAMRGRDPLAFEAWVKSDWTGAIKPSTDAKKGAQGMEILVKHGWSDNDRAARELTGTKYSKNVRKLKRQNEALVAAMAPLLEAGLDANGDPVGGQPPAKQGEAIADIVREALAEAMEDLKGDES